MFEPIETLRQFVMEIVLGAVTTWAIVECWHHGMLFARWRAYLETRDGFLPELLSCPFCLSHWVALGVVVPLELLRGLSPHTVLSWFLVLAYTVFKAFTVTRLANLANDVFSGVTCTPNRKSDE